MSTIPVSPASLPQDQRFGPVRAISLLLLLQAIGLGAILVYRLLQIDWSQELQQSNFSEAALDILATSTLFAPIVLVLVPTALGFAFLRRTAWLVAMICQACLLLVCLMLYSDGELQLGHSYWLYPIMLSGILLVLYLNSTDVRLAFHVRHSVVVEEDEEEEAAEDVRRR